MPNEKKFFLPSGTILRHVPEGETRARRLRFVAHLGAWTLHLVDTADEDSGPYMVAVAGADDPVLANVAWLLAEHAAGRLFSVDDDAVEEGEARLRVGRFLGLDRAACASRDPKSVWRHDWALAAITSGMPRTATTMKQWISSTDLKAAAGDPREVRVLFDRKPTHSAVIRWMNTLSGGGMRLGAMVNRAGRMPGQSQLSDVEDRIVDHATLHFLSDPRLATIDEAAALGTRWWLLMKDRSVEGLGHQAPTEEAYRLRVRSLDGQATTSARSGSHAARRYFEPSGEPIPTERPFERVFIDGTTFRHAVTYSDDWPIPSNKMKGVFCMDAHTLWVPPAAVFSGPFRPEMGIQAILNLMTPPDVTEAELATEPYAGQFFGIPSTLMGDNDKTLIPPAIVPLAVTIIGEVELAAVYNPNAKADLENFFKYIKKLLAGVRGLVLGPRFTTDPRYDPITSANVTRAVYAQMIDQGRRKWNSHPRRRFGNRSPNDLMAEFAESLGPRLSDPGLIRRQFASIPPEKQVLTNNGLVYDNLHYRWFRPGTSVALENGNRRLPMRLRLEGTAKALVPIRVYDGNVDRIEVLDESTGEYHEMWSTNPRYTGGLSRWEHHQYMAMITAGKGGAVNDAQRLLNKSQMLVAFDQEMPAAAFRARETMTALIEREDVRAAAGARGRKPQYGSLPKTSIATIVGGVGRQDTAEPPPQPRGKNRPPPPSAPARPADYGTASINKGALGDGPPTDQDVNERQQRDAPNPSVWAQIEPGRATDPDDAAEPGQDQAIATRNEPRNDGNRADEANRVHAPEEGCPGIGAGHRSIWAAVAQQEEQHD